MTFWPKFWRENMKKKKKRAYTNKFLTQIFIQIGCQYLLFFECCGFRRVLIYPKGNNVEYLSLYLDVGDSATLPHGWTRYARFSVSMINQIHNTLTVRKGKVLWCFYANSFDCTTIRLHFPWILSSAFLLVCFVKSCALVIHFMRGAQKKEAKS